jgi:hypothetical protein
MAEISLTDFFHSCHGYTHNQLRQVAYHSVRFVLGHCTRQKRLVLNRAIRNWQPNPADHFHVALKVIMRAAQVGRPPGRGYMTPPPLELRKQFLDYLDTHVRARARAIDTLRRRVNRVRDRHGLGPVRGAWQPSEEDISARLESRENTQDERGHESMQDEAPDQINRHYRIEGPYERAIREGHNNRYNEPLPLPLAGHVYATQYEAGADAMKHAGDQETWIVCIENDQTVWHSLEDIYR